MREKGPGHVGRTSATCTNTLQPEAGEMPVHVHGMYNYIHKHVHVRTNL